MILFLVPAFLAMLLAKLWFLAALPLFLGLRAVLRNPGERLLVHPLVQLGLAWLLIAAPTLWPGRTLPPHPWFPRVPAYTCLDMLLLTAGFVWFFISFLRIWGHRPRRSPHAP